MLSTLFKFLAAVTLTLGISFFAFGPAQAGDNEVFNAQVDDAYANYRAALFQSNTNNPDATQKSLTEFQTKWAAITERFGANKPPQFQNEEAWNETLSTIASLAQEAQTKVQGGNLAGAHNILEGIRDELTALRERNGVVSFSDQINAYHSEMEQVLGAGYSAETLNDETLHALREQMHTLARLAENIERTAPASLHENAEFKTLLNNLIGSVSDLKSALHGDDKAAIVKAISALKPAYAKLFVKFG